MANAGPPADRGGVHKSHGPLGANTQHLLIDGVHEPYSLKNQNGH